jgi:hypothetical protein
MLGFRREKRDENPCPSVFDLATEEAETSNGLVAQLAF